MQRRVAIAVLVRQVLGRDPGQQIDQSDLRLGVAGPVHGSAATVVPASDVHPLLLEVVKGDWLVALGCHVHDVDAIVVLRVDVGSVLE